PLLVMRSNLWASGYDVDGTDQTSLGQFSGRVQQTYKHSVPRFFVPEHGTMFTLALVRFPPTATKEISVNFCVMEAIKLCRLDTPIIFIEARINLSRFVVTGCAAKTSATVTFPSLNLISLFAFCFNIWLNGVAS